MRLTINTCSAGDSERTIGAIIVIWPLHSDIAAIKEDSPEALPFGLSGCDGAGTLAVVMPYLLLVGGIIHRVVKPKNVTKRLMRWMPFLYGIGNSMFHYVNSLGVACVG